jgi:hypothetical protein
MGENIGCRKENNERQMEMTIDNVLFYEEYFGNWRHRNKGTLSSTRMKKI